MFEKFPPLTVFAHRGSSAYAPENTLSAFHLAATQGADAIELDAKLTRDGEVVVIHDLTVDRTTNGVGRVKDLSLQEIKRLDAGSNFSQDYRGENIPTLAEVFEQIGDKLLINVELTNYSTRGDELPERAAKLVQKYGLSTRVIFSSFVPSNLSRARRISPDIPNALLTMAGWQGKMVRILSIRTPYEALHPYFTDVDEGLIEREHKLKHKVNVWTVNSVEEIRRLADLHVDGIITDDPVLTRKILARR